MSVLIRGAQILSMVESARPVKGDLLVSGSRISTIGDVAATPPDT